MKLPELSHTDYGLIGRPLGHSQSKAFFAALFAAKGSTETYDNFELPELDAQLLYRLVLLNPSLKGFNVTAPYKVRIIDFLDSLSPQAQAVGAVNTVKICRDDTGYVRALRGYNTDVEGFRESVRPMTDKLAPGQGALVLGTGGASRAVVEALRQLGVQATLVSRTPAGDHTIGYGDITRATIEANPLIVNATPLGTYPGTDAAPPFPYDLLDSACMCHDLVYNPSETRFMQLAAERGATVKNGLEMLHRQAEASLKIWNTKD